MDKRAWAGIRGLLTLCAALPLACGASGGGSPQGDGGGRSDSGQMLTRDSATSTPCVPGQSIACVGTGGCHGGQVCSAGGSHYGPCECSVQVDAGSRDAHSAQADSGRDGTLPPADSGASEASTKDSAIDVEHSPTPDAEHDSSREAARADSSAADAREDAHEKDAGRDAAPPFVDAGTPTCSALAACPPGTKVCSSPGAQYPNYCVQEDDPAYGCEPSSCSPCTGSLPNAVAECSGTACVIASCAPGFADCDGNPANGCEADLTDPATCTLCTTSCGAGESCVSSGCVSTCTAPNTDCAGTCVTLASDPHACGGCNTSCGSFAECVDSKCACETGWTLNGNSCSPPPSDPPCTPSMVLNPGGGWFGLECAPTSMFECYPPLSLCGEGAPMPGSCVDTQSSPSDCGGCGVKCATGEVCTTGTCQPLSSVQLFPGLASPKHLAVNATQVFWTDTGDDTVNTGLIGGGARTILASSNAGVMTIDDNYVYWVDATSGDAMAVAMSGGGMPMDLGATGGATFLAVGTASLYWLGGTSNLTVYEVPKGGGSAPAVDFVMTTSGPSEVQDVGTGLVYYNGHLYSGRTSSLYQDGALFTDGENPNTGLWGNGYDLLWNFVDGTNGWLSSLGALNYLTYIAGAPFLFAPPILSNGCAVYTLGSGTQIWRLFEHNAALPTPMFAGATQTNDLAVDASFVYWADGSGYIGRVTR